MLGSETPAGEGQSPLRREGEDPAAHRHLHFGRLFAAGHRSVRLEGRAWKYKLEEVAALLPCYHQFFFKSLALWEQR